MKLRPSYWTLRARLTVTFAAVFTLAGMVVLAVSYAVVSASLTGPGPGLRSPQPRPSGSDQPDAETFAEVARLISEEWDRQRAATLTSLLAQSGIALILTMALATIAGWLIAGRTLRRLALVTQTAKNVTDATLHQRVGLEGGHDEVQELADSVDQMLARLDRSFDSQSRFVANASHELRTPLAVERTLLEVEIGEPDASDDLKRVGMQLLRINERHARMLDDLLTMASTDVPLADLETVDLAELVTHALSITPVGGVEITTDLSTAITQGSPGLLDRLVLNLVGNAVQHNQPDGWIQIRTYQQPGAAILEISNSGPVIPTHDVSALLMPFSRGRDRVGAGHGLGLSIVGSVVQRHHGTWTFSPRTDGGVDIVVSLPRQ